MSVECTEVDGIGKALRCRNGGGEHEVLMIMTGCFSDRCLSMVIIAVLGEVLAVYLVGLCKLSIMSSLSDLDCQCEIRLVESFSSTLLQSVLQLSTSCRHSCHRVATCCQDRQIRSLCIDI